MSSVSYYDNYKFIGSFEIDSVQSYSRVETPLSNLERSNFPLPVKLKSEISF